MTYGNILDEVISGLQPEHIPSDYIVMAKIVNLNGVERILRGGELQDFMNDPNRGFNVSEARVILDVRKIRTTITTILFDFFEELNSNVSDLTSLKQHERNDRREDDFGDDEDWTPNE